MATNMTRPKTRPRHHRRGAQAKKQSVRSREAAWDAQDFAANPDLSGWCAPIQPTYSSGWGFQDHVNLLQDFVSFWRKNVAAAEHGESVEKLADFFDRLPAEEDNWVWESQNATGWNATGDAAGWGVAEDGAGWGPAGDDGGRAPQGQGNWAAGEQGGWGSGGDGGWGTMDWIGREDPWALGESRRQERHLAADGAGERQSDKTAKVSGSGSGGGQGARSDGEDSSSFVDKVALIEQASPSRQKSMQQFYMMSTQQKVEKIEEVVDFLRRHR